MLHCASHRVAGILLATCGLVSSFAMPSYQSPVYALVNSCCQYSHQPGGTNRPSSSVFHLLASPLFTGFTKVAKLARYTIHATFGVEKRARPATTEVMTCRPHCRLLQRTK